jgi:hypothetical protein
MNKNQVGIRLLLLPLKIEMVYNDILFGASL